jgi:GTPase-associated protein 1, N-terminal domain type 2
VAWQLHYTSARSGPTGRAGFQFVAETPDLPPGMRAAVTPFMAYRPPPQAPLSPGAAELTGFPVALGYDRVAGWPLLVRCRYLGQDYSGRQGNFFGHAVVAEAGELEGLRPVELWGAPHWAARPGQGELPALDDLVPGTAFAPEALAGWCSSRTTPS